MGTLYSDFTPSGVVSEWSTRSIGSLWGIICANSSLFISISVLVTLKGYCCIVTAKSKRAGESILSLYLTCSIGDVIQITLRIRLLIADCRRQNAALKSDCRSNKLYSTCSTQHMSVH